jgi:hypothetical protein
LCSGWGLRELARFIQEERKEYTEISRTGLEQQLLEFRKAVPAGHLVQKRFPKVYDDARDKVQEGIDELNELEELYRIQMHRIGVDFGNEKKIKKLMPSMTSEIREARQLLESMANLKMELGLSSRASKSVDVNVEVEAKLTEDVAEFANPAVQQVLEDPESRRKVEGVVHRILKLAASNGEPKEAV